MDRAWVSGLAVALAASVASATPVVYVVNPAQSQLTLSGAISGLAITAQSPGSLTATYQGAIAATLLPSPATATAISLDASSPIPTAPAISVQARDLGNYRPNAALQNVAAPAAYGLAASAGFLGNLVAAGRGIALQPTHGSQSLSMGQFPTAGATLTFTQGQVHVLGTGIVGLATSANDLAGNAGVVDPAGPLATLSSSGLVETLTLPVDATVQIDANGAPVTLNIDGQIVARRLVGDLDVSQQVGGPDVRLAMASLGVVVIGDAADLDGDGPVQAQDLADLLSRVGLSL